ncbi:MAG: ABC transporter transmembrane domain-containing protein, partial [Stackebrandtia sp.]
GVVVVLAVFMATAGVLRHRIATYNFLTGAYRVVLLTTRHATRVGAVLPQRIATGEVVSVGGSDPVTIGMLLDVLSRTIGSVIAFAAVAVVLLNISLTLGAVILIGLPAQALLIGPLLKPLQHREHTYREAQGVLTSRANDIVAGLRVLRGIGGEELFTKRYVTQSQRVRRLGIRVAGAAAIMKGLQMLLPGVLVAAVTWLGARQVLANEITTGELISVFGYTSFLLMPMSVFLETARKYTTAHAACRRIVKLLEVSPAVPDNGDATPEYIRRLTDPESEVTVDTDKFTALVCGTATDAAALGDRLARYTDSEATADGTLLRDIDLTTLRRLVLLSDNDTQFFAGRLRDQLDVTGTASDTRINAAVQTAVATDAVDSLGGLDGTLDADGRNVSGGQRQRLRLVRALLVDAPTVILIEPTSAVDAHTEALIGQRLRQARDGRGTVVATTSPLLLEHSDIVKFVMDGKLIATGTHRELMDNHPGYRAVITRDTETEAQEVAA